MSFRDLLTRTRTTPDDASSDGGNTDSVDIAATQAQLRSNRKRVSKLDRDAANADLQRELDKLYTPENWKKISTMYFDARYVQTGDPEFRCTDAEETTLGTSLAASARLLLKIDPGYIALIIFMANMGQMITMKEVKHSQKVKASRGLRAVPNPAS